MTEWLCHDRQGELPDNAMIVKEMRGINESLDIRLNDEGCMEIPDPDLEAESWAIMVKHAKFSHDGWYWAGFSASPADPDDPGKINFIGNPPINDRSAVTTSAADFFGPPPVKRNSLWYPTGILFEPLPGGSQMPSVVFPYNEFGNYCVNCHASAESESTYSSLDNPSPYIQLVGEIDGQARHDPYYYDPELTGADRITYRMTLDPATLARVDRIEVTLYNQSIPPFYLQERFRDANVGPRKQDHIQRLFYLTSHLNTSATDSAGETYIDEWKLKLASACQTMTGACADESSP